MSVKPVSMSYTYDISDILELPLSEDWKTRNFTGNASFKTKIPIVLTATSDFIGKSVSAFAQVSSTLWLYLVSGLDGRTLYVFNGKAAGLTHLNITEHRGKTIIDTLKKIKPYVASVYVSDYKSPVKWSRVDADHLHEVIPAEAPVGQQDAGGAIASATE